MVIAFLTGEVPDMTVQTTFMIKTISAVLALEDKYFIGVDHPHVLAQSVFSRVKLPAEVALDTVGLMLFLPVAHPPSLC